MSTLYEFGWLCSKCGQPAPKGIVRKSVWICEDCSRNKGRKRLSWEETALKLAFNIADYRSEDPYVQVGAVIIKNDNSIILGYNGAPPNVDIDWSDRDARRDRVIHAEANAVDNIKFGEAKLMATTAMPCKACMVKIAGKGIKKVYYSQELDGYDNVLAKKLAEEFGIQLIQKP